MHVVTVVYVIMNLAMNLTEQKQKWHSGFIMKWIGQPCNCGIITGIEAYKLIVA